MWGTAVGDTWKLCGHFLLPALENPWISWISWTSGCNRFPCYFFLMFVPWFRLRKFPWFLTFICRGKFLRHFSHQTAKVCIFQLSLRTWRCVRFWISSCPRVRFPCRCFEYPWAFSTQSGASRMRNSRLDVRFIAVGFEFPTILSSSFCSCILFAVVLGKLVKLKFWSQQVELKWMMVNKLRKMFHSSHVKLPLVNMTASWCLVSMYQIWIFGCRLILSNNQSRTTLWVLDACLIVGLLPFIIILITTSLSSRTYNIAPHWKISHLSRNVINIIRIQIDVLSWILVFHVGCGVPRQVSLWLLIFGFVNLVLWWMKYFNRWVPRITFVNLHPEK